MKTILPFMCFASLLSSSLNGMEISKTADDTIKDLHADNQPPKAKVSTSNMTPEDFSKTVILVAEAKKLDPNDPLAQELTEALLKKGIRNWTRYKRHFQESTI